MLSIYFIKIYKYIEMEGNIGFENLPTETLTKVLIDSDINTLSSLCLTNTKLSSICDDEYIWRRKLEMEYPSISYKDTYLALSSISKLLNNSVGELYPDNRDTDNIQITRIGKYNLYRNYPGGYYEVLPDISIISRKHAKDEDITNEILDGYGIHNDSGLNNPVERLIVKRTFPNDMDLVKIVNEGRAELVTFKNAKEIPGYLYTLESDDTPLERWMFVDVTKAFGDLEAYALKSLGLVNTFEYDENENLVLIP
ncbi:F-box domain-containing protein [Orpheovirus IHUMI-LCC2]|uniref:F-box domain-containing protein n=1 Tax=Orpheovirus IHUMI-LCC2 TaxID=2023057 RepID=A0A2I2L371_9VIRU|nr:F-box domain-containing protein [Orpheovirus IHUMI-LCC2]SNW61995.1 F-box domain-containing protein [Orpheovirus IHUMI-LCC2]